MKTQNTLLFALICGAVWSANAADQTKTPEKEQFQQLLETIDWNYFTSDTKPTAPTIVSGKGETIKVEHNYMHNLGNSSQDMPNNQNPHSGTVGQSDEERKSHSGSPSSNTPHDGNDSFEFIEHEEISSVESENRIDPHNASFIDALNEASSYVTNCVSDCASSAASKMQRIKKVITNKDLELKFQMEKLNNQLDVQEKDRVKLESHNKFIHAYSKDKAVDVISNDIKKQKNSLQEKLKARKEKQAEAKKSSPRNDIQEESKE